MNNLTIVSVAYNCKEHLIFNYKILLLNNDMTKIRWIVMQNGKERIPKEFESHVGAKRPSNKSQVASIHHSMALNKSLKHLGGTRYVLFLDADFYLAPPLESIMEYMQQKGLAFFGATYSNKRAIKTVEGFPVAFCVFVDTHQVDIYSLNFSLIGRNNVDHSDTGYRIYDEFKTYPYEGIRGKHNEKVKSDTYQWRGELFGIHARMKMHFKRSDGSLRRLKDIKTRMFRAKGKKDKMKRKISKTVANEMIGLWQNNYFSAPELACVFNLDETRVKDFFRPYKRRVRAKKKKL